MLEPRSSNLFLSLYPNFLCTVLLDMSLMSFMLRYFSSEIELTHSLKVF